MPEQPPTLRELINEAVSSGITFAQLAERTADPTTGKLRASGGYINRIANGKVSQMPVEAHVRALADALRIPYERVRQAAIAQWLPAAPDEEAERERLELLAEAKRLRDQAAAIEARLERQERDEEADGGRRAG